MVLADSLEGRSQTHQSGLQNEISPPRQWPPVGVGDYCSLCPAPQGLDGRSPKHAAIRSASELRWRPVETAVSLVNETKPPTYLNFHSTKPEFHEYVTITTVTGVRTGIQSLLQSYRDQKETMVRIQCNQDTRGWFCLAHNKRIRGSAGIT